MPLLDKSGWTVENFLADVALQRSARNMLTMQLIVLQEGLERPICPVLKETSTYRQYLVGDFETLPQIATRFYGNPDRWPDLATANNLEHPFIVVPGQVLKIPK